MQLNSRAKGSLLLKTLRHPFVRRYHVIAQYVQPKTLQHSSIGANESLHCVDFLQAAQLQRTYVNELLDSRSRESKKSDIPNYLLLMQLNHVYTLGRRQAGPDVDSTIAQIREATGVPILKSQRGGLITYHGPGQLVVYPIIDLRQLKLGPRKYIALLEETMMRTCAEYGVEAFTTEHPGLWATHEKKIGAVGVHIERGIASSGISLNVNPEIHYFDQIDFCGLSKLGKVSTSLRHELGTAPTIKQVATKYIHHFRAVFGVTSTEQNVFV